MVSLEILWYYRVNGRKSISGPRSGDWLIVEELRPLTSRRSQWVCLLVLAVIAGAVVAFQSAINANLTRGLGDPLRATRSTSTDNKSLKDRRLRQRLQGPRIPAGASWTAQTAGE
jgi:hypothetical protein